MKCCSQWLYFTAAAIILLILIMISFTNTVPILVHTSSLFLLQFAVTRRMCAPFWDKCLLLHFLSAFSKTITTTSDRCGKFILNHFRLLSIFCPHQYIICIIFFCGRYWKKIIKYLVVRTIVWVSILCAHFFRMKMLFKEC